MKQLARIIKDCGHRGKVGHVYEVIETNPREGKTAEIFKLHKLCKGKK